MLFKPSIERAAKRRGITLLLHSTHLYRNLPLILADGRIHTARELTERHGPERAARLLHDPHRYEQLAVGLDYINATLSAPNVELLYHRSQTEWQSEWVHLALDLSLLSRPTTRFSPVSAAAGHGSAIAGGYAGFRALFADKVTEYNRKTLTPAEPTHPQAEVLLHGPLELSLITGIYVPQRSIEIEVARLCMQHGLHVHIHVAPHLFVWPARLTKSRP